MKDQTRRTFMKSAAVTAAATIVPRHVLGGPKHVAPSDRVNVAVVGVGGRGFQNTRDLLKLDDVRVVAVCDPCEHWNLDGFYYKGVAGRSPVAAAIEAHHQTQDSKFTCRQHVDYREMLDHHASDIDAVLCATPDHQHAGVTLRALRAGKHVYCEKPLTHNIWEARLVAKVAAESGLATQMGNQGHSTDEIRLTCEWLQSGVLGEIREVHAWVPATRWNRTLLTPPTESEPIPSTLKWDLWCGPRTPVDYHHAYAPVAWRDFWQFGCGAMGDFGCHDLDSAVWGLGLDVPTRIEMLPAGSTHPGLIPFGEIGYFDFARPGGGTPIRITWYSGGIRPPRPESLPETEQLPSRGVLFVGERGVMVCGGAGGRANLYPRELFEQAITPEPTIPRSRGHHRDWLDAIKGGRAASSEFSYGAKLTEITLLGVLALRVGTPILWDANNLRAIGNSKVDELIHGKYRDGWKLEAS
jgi:predicted dehydrogenase